MNKSPLRMLAADFADGRLARSEYRARRRELIDGIVAGTVAVEHEAPFQLVAPAGASPPRRPTVPWPMALAGASAMCVLALAWFLWPRAQPPVPRPPPVVSAPEVPRSRTLVESFVALRDFSDASIARFETDWSALDETERETARAALWFRSLVQALRDEVKTRKALAGLAGGDDASARVRRVLELAEHLGIAAQLPALDAAPALPAEPVPDAPARPVPAANAPPSSRDPGPPSPAGDAAGPEPPAQTQRPSGTKWLAARAADELTLQIFAVNSLDRVELLLSRHPDLELHVLASDGGTPRFRVFHGVFRDVDAARTAFAALPADVTQAAGNAIVKSFSAVREDLRATPATAHATSTPVPAAATRGYTLQLFASPSRTNADALLEAFPELALEVREVPGDAVRYRVVHGRYATTEQARAAGDALPPALLSRIGRPLPKSLAELGGTSN